MIPTVPQPPVEADQHDPPAIEQVEQLLAEDESDIDWPESEKVKWDGTVAPGIGRFVESYRDFLEAKRLAVWLATTLKRPIKLDLEDDEWHFHERDVDALQKYWDAVAEAFDERAAGEVERSMIEQEEARIANSPGPPPWGYGSSEDEREW